MKKTILISLILIALIFTSASAIVLFTGVLSRFSTTVNPAEITFLAVESHIPSLNSLSTFSTDTYNPAGTEMSIANINITHAHIEVTDLSLAERNAFTNLTCHVNIYNSTYTLLNSSFTPLLDQRLYITNQSLIGDWDLAIKYTGTTALVETAVPVSFNVIINLTTDTPMCTQWLGAGYQINTTYWYALEDTNITVTNQNCTTDQQGYSKLNLSKYGIYTATGNHSDYTETSTRSFIACADANDSTGYPIILRFRE